MCAGPLLDQRNATCTVFIHMNAPSLTHIRSYLDDEPTMREARPWHQPGTALSLAIEPVALPRRARRAPPESVESLSLPDGLREEMLAIGTAPRGALQARIWLVRVARELARDYRIRYGLELRTDAASIERVQRNLSSVVQPQGRSDAKALAREVARHGLWLGEVLARMLGATWLELSGDRPGTWEVFAPPGETFNPILRVQRFLNDGTRGKDLVALFLDLDAAQRREATQ